LKIKLTQWNRKEFKGYSFWRYQLANNFQHVKWFPHLVHRIDFKDRFNFVGDGMNTDRTNDAELVSNYEASWFTRWGSEYQDEGLTSKYNFEDPTLNLYERLKSGDGYGTISHSLPTNEMILDISSLGGFLTNIIEKRKHHASFWNESDEHINIGGRFYRLDEWAADQKKCADWTQKESPFNIPEIMKIHVGELSYRVRQDILNKIEKG